MSAVVARVAVEKTSASFDDLFDYIVPDYLCESVRAGARVTVPFGRGNRKRAGVVFSVERRAPEKGLKEIYSAAEDGVFLSAEMLEIACRLRETTFCTYYEAVRAALPAGLSLLTSEEYELAEGPPQTSLSAAEQRLMNEYYALDGAKERAALFTRAENRRVVAALASKGIIQKKELSRRRVGDETEQTVYPTGADAADMRLSPKQKKVLETLGDVGAASVKELCYLCGVTVSVIKNLERKGLTETRQTEVSRAVSKDAEITQSLSQIRFSPLQQSVYDGLKQLMDSPEAKCALLHGVTGSGKTSVFIKLIETATKAGKTAIMLVPEISLTPQTVEKFQSLFGNTVAIMHSRLSLGQRADEFKRIARGEAKIVIGTRSAVFAPVENLGIIVIDEEDEHTYKSERAPRYHAREVAKQRCFRHKALLLLASATPSFDSYSKALSGRYSLFEMEERYSSAELPEVRMIDMRIEAENGCRGNFSEELLEELRLNLERGEQSMLLLNRRGYNTYACCIRCGAVVECPNCAVPLTYHKVNESAICHICGFRREMPKTCEKCGSRYIYQSGTGTQRIEDELKEHFPQARVLRMDADTTMSRFSYERRFSEFRNGEYDIMIGTQMIAKGLDFENVTLVGVLLIDRSLYAGDYLGYERTFSLITQVVGRCGRGSKKGRAYIQTFSPDHYVLELAARQDYKGFYEQEAAVRRALIFPPFCDICLFAFSSEDEKAAQRAAELFFGMLKSAADERRDIPVILLGPTDAGKAGGFFRRRIVIKCRQSPALRELLRGAMREAYSREEFRKVSFYADFNGELI